MRAIIQTVPERLAAAEEQRKALNFPCDIHVDVDKTGPFKGFVASLNAFDYGDEYRLHMQDDLILCDDFKDYIPEVERIMREKDMHLMSLYAPRYKQHLNAHAKGRPYVKSIAGFAMQCIVFSPLMVKHMKELAPFYTFSHHDDWFVTEVCWATKTAAYVHIPSLTQHNVFEMKSVMGHATSERRTSQIFEKDFVTKWKAKQS
jgi:hypothetical protein